MMAQDTIVKYNGELVYAKVIEITPTEVKYKKFLDGPTYIDTKTSIHLIKFINGYTEIFSNNNKPAKTNSDYYSLPDYNNKIEIRGSRYRYHGSFISEREVHKLLLESKNKSIISLVGRSKDAHILQFIGFAAIPLGIAALHFFEQSGYGSYGYGSYGYVKYNDGDMVLSTVCLVGAVACPVASIINKHKRTMSNRKAIKIYNEQF